jgi:RimJ/RimL family protein N-acetyltransferase
VSKKTKSLTDWKPVRTPRAIALSGRFVALEPLDAARHTDDLWVAIKDHPALFRWFRDGPHTTRTSLRRALMAKISNPSLAFFAIVPVATERIAGYACLMRFDPLNGVVEVGDVMFSPELQQTREATEAMYLMAGHVFDDLGYRRYEWKCHSENEPSRRAATRFGFSFEGIFRQHMVVKGRNRDTAWFAMLDSEWPAQRRAFEAWLRPENFDARGRQRKRLSAFLKKR